MGERRGHGGVGTGLLVGTEWGLGTEWGQVFGGSTDLTERSRRRNQLDGQRTGDRSSILKDGEHSDVVAFFGRLRSTFGGVSTG